jgi:hypothetical protein
MSASKLYPKIFRGVEQASGCLWPNRKPKSDKSPHWSGHLYLPGAGWYWVNAWEYESKAGPHITLSLREMTDEQCERKFGAPAARGGSSQPRPPPDDPPSGQGDIPF